MEQVVEMVEVETLLCPVCRKASTLRVRADGYRKWIEGAFVQDAFPDLSAGERELLITGTHPRCWDEMFAEDEDNG